MKLLRVESRDQWRLWLSQNYERAAEVWLVFHKAHTGKGNVPYDETVQEALCFGWIDSLIKRIDDVSYARKYTPRRPGSVWSESNKARAEKMITEGRMTEAGMRFVDEAKASGEWAEERTRPILPKGKLPNELQVALAAHPSAERTFHALAPTYQKQYILWIATAKRSETRYRRAAEAVEKLKRGERLGLK